MKKYLIEKTWELSLLLGLPEEDFYTDCYLIEVARNYAHYRLGQENVSGLKGVCMPAKKTQILVMDLDFHEHSVFPSLDKAEEWMAAGGDEEVNPDSYKVFEIVQELCVTKETKLSISKHDC